MLHHAGMSTGFWAEATATAAHILNRAPRKNLGWRTPFELFFGRVPEISYLRVFGCRALVYKDNAKKWDQNTIPMVHVGYEPGSKAFRPWNPKTRTVIVSTNVRFDETVFPNRPPNPKPTPSPSTIPSPILPSPTHIVVPGIVDNDDDDSWKGMWRPKAPTTNDPPTSRSSSPNSDYWSNDNNVAPPPNTLTPSSTTAEPPFSHRTDLRPMTPPNSPLVPEPTAPRKRPT